MLARTPANEIGPPPDEVIAALKQCRSAFSSIAVFSACVNVLSLTGSLYMMQISDRVMSSRSVSTLTSNASLGISSWCRS